MSERYRRGGWRDQNESFDSRRRPNERGGRRDMINRGDYRGDFGPEGSGRFDDPNRRRRQDWPREQGAGGFGSEYGAWRSGIGFAGAGFGFGREEDPGRGPEMYGGGGSYGHGDMNTDQPGRDFDDSDWAPNRPARGAGVWSGDWSDQSGGQIGRGRSTISEDYTGRGPKDYRRSDERIRDEVCDRLTDDRAVDATEVSIRVEGGEVILTGTVPSREQKRRAEECVERVSGVRDVINQLRVARADTAGSPQTTTPAQGRAQRSPSSQQQSGVAADRSGER